VSLPPPLPPVRYKSRYLVEDVQAYGQQCHDAQQKIIDELLQAVKMAHDSDSKEFDLRNCSCMYCTTARGD
jgi:ribosomal protein L32